MQYAVIVRAVKIDHFLIENLLLFLFFAQNIDYRSSLELPHCNAKASHVFFAINKITKKSFSHLILRPI